MKTRSITLRWPVAALVAIALVAAGAGASYLLRETASAPPVSSGKPIESAGARSGPTAAYEALPDVVVPISADAVKRAGIEVVAVSRGAGAASVIRIPGTIEPNAYNQVVVTPLVSGRVTRVLAELGDQVQRGKTLVQVFSPELADAETKYLSARAELDAHERELERTTKLAAIGAASQQEIERLHAEHSAKLAGVQSFRSRLTLLGMSAPAIDGLSPGKDLEATTDIAAPISGVITERAANVGLNVDGGTKLFTVVDLSSVWVVGALYERDLPRVRVGSPASVAIAGQPGQPRQGRVSYIDAQVSADTRTARVRVEVPNRARELRLGMFADVDVATAADQPSLMIPRSAVQSVGNRQVVYLANTPDSGTFTERDVQLGAAAGESVEVLSGLQDGDRVAARGSFFVRAERERLGLRASAVTSSTPSSVAAPPISSSAPDGPKQTRRISVGEQAFNPSRLTLRAGMPARLTFLRTTDKTCATAVVFPSLNIRRELPLNQPVDIEFTPAQAGEIGFVCGMNMLRGTVVVE